MNGILFKSFFTSLLLSASLFCCTSNGQTPLAIQNSDINGYIPAQSTYYQPTAPLGYYPEPMGEFQTMQRYPYVIARPQDRAWIESQPIHLRPDRPLHVYGNFVRRMYDRNPSTIFAQESLLPFQPLQSLPIVRGLRR